MINKEFFFALNELEEKKGISKEFFIEALETALVSAYKKHNNGEAASVLVSLDPEKSQIKFYSVKDIVEEVEDPEKQISLEDAKIIKKSAKVGTTLQEEFIPKNFGRIAAQTAKQVIMQKLREAERDISYSEFSEKENELLIGKVVRIEGDSVYFDIPESNGNRMESLLLKGDQIPGERYELDQEVKVYVKKVRNTPKGPQVLLSRSSVNFVKRLFENEIPEIRQGVVLIKAISREAGQRTKIAIYSTDNNVDAIGACVGTGRSRIDAISSELNGEKLDIINWTPEIVEFIANALRPAQVLMVKPNMEEKVATVIVPDSKLSLAIGKDGINAKLAARLTGWKIDVKPQSFLAQESEQEVESEENLTEEN